MTKLTTFISTLAMALPLSGWASGNLFTGSIMWSTSTDPIVATEQWAAASSTLSWNISYHANSAFPWVYEYSWSAPTKGLSHIILEVSAASLAADFSVPAGSEGPRTWSPSDPGNSNPGLPGNVFGIKYDGGGVTSKTFTFGSTHAPTWGDFFAKDGTNRRGGRSYDVYAYNAGFLQADPLVDFTQIALGNLMTLQHTGLRANHIAVPDTYRLTPPDFGPPPSVPEAPAGMGLVSLVGGAAYGVQRRRRSTPQAK